MTQRKTKPAAPESAKPKPVASVTPITNPTTPEEETVAQRTARGECYKREAAKLAALKLDWFKDLGEEDLVNVLALADLLAYGLHEQATTTCAGNWVGVFISAILQSVAYGGPAAVNAEPSRVKHDFDDAMYDLHMALITRRAIDGIDDSVTDLVGSYYSATPEPL